MDTTTTGLPLLEAAQKLGLSVDALRKRIQRGTLKATKGEDGLWYVEVDELRDTDQSDDQSNDKSDGADDQSSDQALIATLKEEVAWLRETLEREREMHGEAERRRDVLFAQFGERLDRIGATTTSVQEQVEAVAHEVIPEPSPAPEPQSRLGSWWHWFVTGQRSRPA